MPKNVRLFTPEQVVRIREQYAEGVSSPELARIHSVNPRTIRYIAYGHSYKDVGGPRATPMPHGKQRRPRRRVAEA